MISDMIYQDNSLLGNFFIVGLLVAIASAIFLFWGNRTQLPPGPPRWPIIGNFRYLTALGKPRPWHLFHRLAQEYGPLIYLNLLGKPVIIITSAQVANDLLVRRASNYSNRPRMIVGGEYLAGGLNFFISNGEMWRKMRRASEVQLGAKSLIEYENIQLDEGILFAYEMLAKPKNCRENISRATASVILSISYDEPPLRSLDNPSVRLMDDFTQKLFLAIQPGAHLVEAIPILEYLPSFLTPWKKNAKRDFEKFSSLFLGKYMSEKEKALAGEQRPSFCRKLLETKSRHGMNDTESAWVTAMIYGAAYDTTAATLSWFFLIMIQFPDAQIKAQEEIDTVIGHSRLPSFSDRSHLPYVGALIRELLRWRPVAPIGVPHVSEKDDYYNGQFIPGGSICISNIWSINRDPEVYGEDADTFRPERHLDSHGKLKDEKDEGNFTFGFGKRDCVGKHFANKALFINITMVLWAMSIEASVNALGEIVVPSISEDIGEGITSHPPPFECRFKPRFPGVDMVLKQAYDAIFSAHGG